METSEKQEGERKETNDGETAEKQRTFQKVDFESFAEKRRQVFLERRKIDRECRLSRSRHLARDDEEENILIIEEITTNENEIEIELDVQNEVEIPIEGEPQNENEIEIDKNNLRIVEDENEQLKEITKKPSRPKLSNRARRNLAINKAYRKRTEFVSEFMIYDWIIDIPNDLEKNWLVAVRPEGERCLVMAHNGRTISRTRNGNILHQFPSELPSGNFKQQQQQASLTMLDCIFIHSTNTYYVMDIIYWLDHPVYDSDAEFRLWFLKSKLNECYQIDKVSHFNRYPFIPIQVYPVTEQNLTHLYQICASSNVSRNYNNTNKTDNASNANDTTQNNNDNNNNINDDPDRINKYSQWPPSQTNPNDSHTNDNNINNNNNNNNNSFLCDGFIFFHKRGRYEHGMSSPLVLLWKDEKTSPWFVDDNNEDGNNNKNNNTKLQYINLRLNKDHALTTHENDIILHVLPNDFIKEHKLKIGDILKFSITRAYESSHQLKVDDLTFIKKCSLSKMLPDTWSKIVFQSQAIHHQNITFPQLISSLSQHHIDTLKMSQNRDDNNNNANRSDDIEDILHISTLGLS